MSKFPFYCSSIEKVIEVFYQVSILNRKLTFLSQEAIRIFKINRIAETEQLEGYCKKCSETIRSQIDIQQSLF